MTFRHGLLIGGTLLAVFACDILRAEEPGGAATNSAVTVQVASSQTVVRRTGRLGLLRGATM